VVRCESGSDRGQAGLAVAGIVVSGTLLVEYLWSRRSVTLTLRAVGLGKPRSQGLTISASVCGLVLLVVPTYALATGSSVATTEGWLRLVPGLFAQAGVAEETLFRGDLFGHLRPGRTFWRAASLSMLPFVAVHLVLFVTLPFWIALAALVLAVVTSFPMAQLFELGGATICPALRHTGNSQGSRRQRRGIGRVSAGVDDGERGAAALRAPHSSCRADPRP
jgi:hypothetical protein